MEIFSCNNSGEPELVTSILMNTKHQRNMEHVSIKYRFGSRVIVIAACVYPFMVYLLHMLF